MILFEFSLDMHVTRGSVRADTVRADTRGADVGHWCYFIFTLVEEGKGIRSEHSVKRRDIILVGNAGRKELMGGYVLRYRDHIVRFFVLRMAILSAVSY